MALVLLFWGDEPPSLLFWSPEYIPGNWPIAIRSQSPMVLWGPKKCQHVTWPEMMKVQTQAPHLAPWFSFSHAGSAVEGCPQLIGHVPTGISRLCYSGLKPYCGWLRKPAAPKGWLKPYKSWDKPSISWCRISQPSTVWFFRQVTG